MTPALLAEAPPSHGEREPARGRQVGIDEHLLGRRAGVVPAAELQRPLRARGHGAERVAPAPQRRQRRVEAAVRLARLEREVGRDRLAHPHRPGAGGRRLDDQRRRHAASEHGGTRRAIRGRARTASASAIVAPASANARSAPSAGPTNTVSTATAASAAAARGDGLTAAPPPIVRAARGVVPHRGTGTSPSAVRTASSGP